jgi:hypothetical protein
MTRPSSNSFQAISSGIGLPSARAAVPATINVATTAKADFSSAIRHAPLGFLADLPRMTDPVQDLY